MQFAYTQRKEPLSPYRSAPPTSGFAVRRSRLHPLAVPASVIATLLLLIYILTRSSSPDSLSAPSGTPHIVLVTDLDPAYGSRYNDIIAQNRRTYAAKHGYGVFLANTTAYASALADPLTGISNAPKSWLKIPAMRHALSLYPHTQWFMYLSPHALLMRPDLSLESHVLNRAHALSKIDIPVVPPDSIIHTVTTTSSSLNLILTQDHEGLCQHSFLLRAGKWSEFFLDAWFDPLYRSYNFQRAEGHALEHLVQWHGTVLSGLALVEQRLLNGYTRGSGDEKFAEGDFVAHFIGCDWEGRSCEEEVFPYAERVAELGK